MAVALFLGEGDFTDADFDETPFAVAALALLRILAPVMGRVNDSSSSASFSSSSPPEKSEKSTSLSWSESDSSAPGMVKSP